MDELVCPQCRAADSSERFTVDRLGIYHWYRQCSGCGQRWSVHHFDPAYDNPYTRMTTPGWRPDRSSRAQVQ